MRISRLRKRLTNWRTQRRAPWPIVPECYGTEREAPHRRPDGSYDQVCPQCDDSHYHVWVEWSDAPFHNGAGVPVRCRICGGRKCDQSFCTNQRHHTGRPHSHSDGYYEVSA